MKNLWTKKKLTAVILCITMMFTLINPAFAEALGGAVANVTTDGAYDFVLKDNNTSSESTGNEDEQLNFGDEAETTTPGSLKTECEECGQTDGHLETCSQYVKILSAGPQEGDTIWIKSGSKVYRDYTKGDEWYNSHTVLGNYKAEIVSIIEAEDGSAAWYEYTLQVSDFAEAWMSMYKYVQAENTSIEEPDEVDKTVCTCGEDAPENLADHADSCLRKQYVKSLFENKTADEIYGEWHKYDEATQTDLLNMIQRWDSAKYEKLKNLVDSETEVSTTLPDGLTVGLSGVGLPKDLSVVVVEETEDVEKMGVINDINSDVLEQFDYTPEINMDFYRTFNIKLYSEGMEWQPDGKKVTVTLGAMDTDLSFSKITITHLLDTAQAVECALANGTANAYQAEGLDSVYPAETAASGLADTIYYVQLYNDMDEGREDIIIDDGQISFELDSFSTVQITATSYDNDVEMPDIEADGTLKLDKTVAEKSDGSYTLTLEAYTTGDTYSKDTEVVIIVDQSGSMYSAVDDESIWESYEEFIENADEDAGKYPGYYVAVQEYNYPTEGPNSDPDKFDENYDYACALIKYDDKSGSWKRSTQIRISKTNYDNCTGGFVFLDECTGPDDWHDFSKNSTNYGDKKHTKYYKTITGATITALETFLDEIQGTDNCKVAVVGFSSLPSKGEKEQKNSDTNQNANRYGWKYGGTGVFVDGEFVHYSNCTESTYRNAFLSVNDTNDFALLQDTVKNLYTDYHGTTTDAGFVLANQIFNESDKSRAETGEKDVNRTVILFTDGEPTERVTSAFADTDNGQRNAAISIANKTKNEYNAHVYAFGPGRGEAIARSFLDLLSSNYPNATTQGSTGEKVSETFAGLADSAEDLKETFKEIGQLVANTATELGSKTVLKDFISASFTLPDGANADDIKAYTAKYDGANFSEEWVPFENARITVSGKEINVDGYDYSKEWISPVPKEGTEDDYGTKLIVQIPIVSNPDFLGGDNVPTNTDASGIYSEGSKVEKFPEPDVDIQVKEIKPDFKNDQIYLSQLAEIPSISNIGKFKIGENVYSVNGINNAYVDIVYTVTDPGEKSMTYTIPAGTSYGDLTDIGWSEGAETHPLLEEDAIYQVTCTVTSKGDVNNNSITNPAVDAKIEVYKPEITFNDSTIELGTTANYTNNGGTTVVWTHGEGQDKTLADVNAMGAAPELVYTYSPEADAFTSDTPVKVTVTSKSNGTSVPDDMDITQHVTFYRDACTFDGCPNETLTTVNATAENRVNFVVHILPFDLVITKSVDGPLDENQTFIFHVTGPNGFVMDVPIVGIGSVTIKDLPVGSYTVTELSDWSWRYEPVGDGSKSVEPGSVNDGVATVPFTNERTENKWLSGDCYVENWWGKDSGTKIDSRKEQE